MMLQSFSYLSEECEDFYWEFYYRGENCILREPIIFVPSPRLLEGSEIQIALVTGGISLLSVSLWACPAR